MKKSVGLQTLLFPMPALLVGTYSEGDVGSAMTAGWASVCCAEPPCLGVAVRQVRKTHENIVRTGSFTLNIPSCDLAEAVDYLGLASFHSVPDKLARAGLHVERAARVNAPLIIECPVSLECKLVAHLDLGCHTWFVGELMDTHVEETLLSETGKIDVGRLDPLCYAMSAKDYRHLGKVVGPAYSMGKAKDKGK
ncbi:MAG: flavin reductase family protein [Myxococcota bacterium]|jgi:flavin reductase (DIM6/NTAB) family NADH-FMN oxidoreductase RutF|nr:flavin reductase family protein [Myxococcota bacterium]